MPATTFNLTGQYRVEQGATYSIGFIIYDDDGTTLYTLTGASAAAKIRETASATTSYSFTCSINTTTSTITVSMTSAETAAIAIENGVWDLELTESDESVHRLLEGEVYISPEVTKT